jgi:hypothetical protein
MYKNELTQEQLEKTNLFVGMLAKVGWDFDDWDKNLENNSYAWPKATPRFENKDAIIGLGYPPKDNYISVLVASKDYSKCVEFRFYYKDDDHLKEALKIIIDFQINLSLDNYTDLIRKLFQICDNIAWENQGFEQEPVREEHLLTDRFVSSIPTHLVGR